MALGAPRIIPKKGTKKYEEDISYFIKHGKLKPFQREKFYDYAFPVIYGITAAFVVIIGFLVYLK